MTLIELKTNLLFIDSYSHSGALDTRYAIKQVIFDLYTNVIGKLNYWVLYLTDLN